jgi:hypothetical protein
MEIKIRKTQIPNQQSNNIHTPTTPDGLLFPCAKVERSFDSFG